MTTHTGSRFMTLLQREFREYKNSLFWTPVITAVILAVLMLASVVLANRISVVGDTLLDAMMRKGNDEVNISISVGEDGEQDITVVEVTRSEKLPAPPVPSDPPQYTIMADDALPGAEDPWDFSREWRFNPSGHKSGDASADTGQADDANADLNGRELNVMLSVVHGILLLILLLTSANYLLSALYDDRKDRSVLFWRSMPVSEWQVVLSKFVVALVAAPLLYIAVSLLLQLAYVLLTMLLVWRMDQDPFEVVVGNIDFVALMLDPISGWVMTALLIAPVYAWLLCASALARRSPFFMAVTPFIGLFFAEWLFFGTEIVGNGVGRHLPHVSDSTAVGFYLFGPDWMALDLLSVAAGLVFAGAALTAAVWLRTHRWEIN